MELGLDIFGLGEHHRPDFLISSPAVAPAQPRSRPPMIPGTFGELVFEP